jgi:S-adenosylmethionine decarboxylase
MEKNLAVAADNRLEPGFAAPGLHLLLDFHGGKHARDLREIEDALRAAAAACGAEVLKVMLHAFGGEGGVTGVALLAESHISIHTWPEIDYIALDIFVCGTCDANKAAAVLLDRFKPKSHHIATHRRGEKA